MQVLQVRFCCCCLSQEQAEWRDPKWKIPPCAPAKVTGVERFSSGAGAVQGYYREIQLGLFVLHAQTPLTCPVVKPQTAFPKKQRSSKFCKTPVGKCSGEGGATVCSAASVGCGAALGQTPRQTWKVRWDVSCL